MQSPSAALSVVALLPEPLAANATLIDPIPFASFADSPFARALFDYFEGLEDHLPASGFLASRRMASRSAGAWSSDDVDDRLINDAGTSGNKWYFDGISSITFTFSAALLGTLPTHTGLVWTDLGLANVRAGSCSVLLEAFDTGNNLLGLIGPSALGDKLFAGQMAEDRFFGITNGDGIGSVRISLLNSSE